MALYKSIESEKMNVVGGRDYKNRFVKKVKTRAIEEEASQTRYREGADCHFKSENVNGRQGGSSCPLNEICYVAGDSCLGYCLNTTMSTPPFNSMIEHGISRDILSTLHPVEV
eukprot:scaffold361_cov424-Pavlova_lutheri.AAC.1